MEYLLMLYSEEAGWVNMTKAQQEQGMAAYMAYTEALKKAGVLKGSNRLGPSATATTVRVTNGKSQVLNGPFSESNRGDYGGRGRCCAGLVTTGLHSFQEFEGRFLIFNMAESHRH